MSPSPLTFPSSVTTGVSQQIKQSQGFFQLLKSKAQASKMSPGILGSAGGFWLLVLPRMGKPGQHFCHKIGFHSCPGEEKKNLHFLLKM